MKLLEFSKRFGTEEDCVQYLKGRREREGLLCPKCGGRKHRWDKYNHRWICCDCHHITTLTSGTVMHGSKLPLMYWFTAMHLLTSTKKTFSAAELQRQLGHKRYQPIWEMLHKLRSVMGQRDGEYKLGGTIELDEGYFTTEDPSDDEKPLKRGIGSQRKAKVLVMVESEPVDEPKKGKKNRKCGHLKMKVVQDLKSSTLESEAARSIDTKAMVVMDNLRSHAGLEEGQQFASLTDIIYRQWSGLTAKEYKQLKGLKKENLRDNMTDLEIAINMLAEATTTQISKNENPKGMAESAGIARRGGAVANDARKAVEKETGMPVVSAMNAKQIALGDGELLLEYGEE